MKLVAELNQSILRGGQRLSRRDLDHCLSVCSSVIANVVKQSLVRQSGLSIAFITERDMRRLNKQWRGKDRVTDVLSFESGEILISYDQAKRQAKELNHSTRDEVIFLIVHGVLHVFGFDHEKPSDAKKMFPLQTKILTKLGIDPRI